MPKDKKFISEESLDRFAVKLTCPALRLRSCIVILFFSGPLGALETSWIAFIRFAVLGPPGMLPVTFSEPENSSSSSLSPYTRLEMASHGLLRGNVPSESMMQHQ
jgi:hypothetical protein